MRASSLLGLSMLIVSLAVVAARAPVPQSSLGLFQGETDVGQVTKRGSVAYDAGRDQYTIAGPVQRAGSGAASQVWVERARQSRKRLAARDGGRARRRARRVAFPPLGRR